MNEKVLYKFPLLRHGFDYTFLIYLLVAILLGLSAWYVLKRSRLDINRKNVLAMFLGFLAFIALGVAGLKWISVLKLQPVVLYTTKLVTPYGSAPYIQIQDFGIKLERKSSLLYPDVYRDSARYLMISEKQGKTHVLSEGDYQIDSIYAALSRLVE